jgi:hypothetical protein
MAQKGAGATVLPNRPLLLVSAGITPIARVA